MAAARSTLSVDRLIMATDNVKESIAPVVPADIDAWLVANDQRIHDELFEFLRIPSVSARTEHTPDVKRRAVAARQARENRIHHADHSDRWSSRGSGGVAQGESGRTDAARVWPLRRAATRAARALDLTGV
jgi:hypothetical protein